jgi:hypothetical protein
MSPRAGQDSPARLTGTMRSCVNKPAPFRSKAASVGSLFHCETTIACVLLVVPVLDIVRGQRTVEPFPRLPQRGLGAAQ